MRVRLGAAPRRGSAYDITVPRERFEARGAVIRLYIDQWEPSALCSSRGALITSYNDRSACAVPLH